MQKKILSVSLIVTIVVMVITGASLAYFTAKDDALNTFTVGNVKIDLIESTYNRVGDNNSTDTSILSPSNIASGMKYVTNGQKAFTDNEIKTNAKTYTEYLAVHGKNMVPGRNAVKCPYVINTGTNDAYIRIRVLIPSAVNNDFIKEENGGIVTNQWCSSSLSSGEFIDGKGAGLNNAPFINRNVEIDGVKYDEYVFVRTEPLAAGAMTEWNVWDYIGISKNATSDDIQRAIDLKAITLQNDGSMSFNIPVQADAIQAEGFDNATTAFLAFDGK